jgi:hypothetical protein
MINAIDKYDINIYVIDNVLHLLAYELSKTSTGFYTCDYEKEIALLIPMDNQHHEEIAYLLDSEEWNDGEHDWEEYDEWETTDYLKEGNTPFLIKTWVRSLPEYIPRKANQ